MNRRIVNEFLLLSLAAFILTLFISSAGIAQTAGDQDVKKQAVEKSININSASIKELSSLPGIGKKRAEAIIAYRTEKGKFQSLEDVKKIEGMGKKLIEKIEDRIVFE